MILCDPLRRCRVPVLDAALPCGQAFFYPTRLAVAFVISVLATVTFCVLTVNVIKSIRDSISRADSAAIRTIFTGLTSVQNLFYSTTSQEVGGLLCSSCRCVPISLGTPPVPSCTDLRCGLGLCAAVRLGNQLGVRPGEGRQARSRWVRPSVVSLALVFLLLRCTGW